MTIYIPTNSDHDDSGLIEIPIINSKVVKEMFNAVGVKFNPMSVNNWYAILTNHSFLRKLFMDHVRLQIMGIKVGIPYYWWIINMISKLDQRDVTGFIYNQWLFPSYIKHNFCFFDFKKNIDKMKKS